MPTEDSLSDDHPEPVGWERDAQDEAEADEAERFGGSPPPAEAMRQSMPLGRFLLLLIVVLIAGGLILYFIFWN